MEPQVKLPTEEAAIKAVVEGKADLDYSVAMEILPKIELAPFKDIALEKLTADVTEPEIDEAIAAHRRAEPALPAARLKAPRQRSGDRVTISFTGTIDGAPFEGGTGDGHPGGHRLEFVHSGLRGAAHRHQGRRDAHRQGDVPAELSEGRCSPGRTAAFEVTAKSVEAPGEVTVDDEFAKQLGMESIAKLRDAVKERIAQEHAQASRGALKRQLLDALDERHKFDLPPTLVDQEFENVWQTVENDLKEQGRTLRGRGHDDEEAQGRIPQDRRAPRAARPGASPRSATRTPSR